MKPVSCICAFAPVCLALILGACSSAATPSAAPAPAQVEKSAKREGPAPVAPVTLNGIRYSALHWGFERGLPQNGGYVIASDAASGQELWLLRVYATQYDAQRERDVQDVFIVELQPASTAAQLQVKDELGRRFIVDVIQRTVTPR